MSLATRILTLSLWDTMCPLVDRSPYHPDEVAGLFIVVTIVVVGIQEIRRARAKVLAL